MKFLFGKKEKKAEAAVEEIPETLPSEGENPEVIAAIALALRLYAYKASQYEETIITIQKVIRPYSPWSSKIYNMKQMPFRPHIPRTKKY
ncbi:MAG: OadG family protein [Niabella sp.]